ncbi:MAG: AAA family ATPase [Saprospiraceae bacterium]|nr:AAA family ATPase [Saprospiraceae bacterium]
MNAVEKLKNVLTHLKDLFVGKDDVIDLLGVALIAKENAFLLGPPGTAKSAIVKQMSNCIDGGNNFEYLLTRFTEPSEIFGPFDIRKLKEGTLVTNIEGMMPEASLVFLDEIFNANSALLNSLLMSLNEKVFRRGKEVLKLPTLMFVGASNLLPEDEALDALLDRFLVRIKCDYVDTDLLDQVLIAGWNLENSKKKERPSVSPKELKTLQKGCRQVDLSEIRKPYVNLVHALRNAGINVSDRRAVKFQNLIAASALLCDREKAILSDLWILKYIWDSEEQIELLAGLVDNIIEKDITPEAHPQARFNKNPNAEELMKEVNLLKEKWGSDDLSFEEKNIIKDKLRYVQTRSRWVNNVEQKDHLEQEINGLWEAILKSI